jgi:hypothetical protein
MRTGVGSPLVDLAASLSYGELALAVAWSGVDLPGARTSRDQVLALGALGVYRHGREAIRAADEQARALRLAGELAVAAAMYGGLDRAERAHELAFSTLPPSLVSHVELDEVAA